MRLRHGGIVFGMAAASLLAVASAWACSVQASVMPLTIDSGPAGTKLAVKGQAAQAGSVEIRWNALAGPLVGSATAGQAVSNASAATLPDFSAEVTVPSASPGVYYLVVAQASKVVARVPFEVTGAAAPSATNSDHAVVPATRSLGSWATSASHAGALSAFGPGTGLLAGALLLGLGGVALFAGAVLAGTFGRKRLRAPRRSR